MKTVHLRRLIATHDQSWNASNFQEIREKRGSSRYVCGDTEFLVEDRFFPVYAAAAELCVDRDDARSATRTLQLLEEESKTADILFWEHGHGCFPQIGEHLNRLFPLSVLIYADDCPAGSPRVIFPIVKYFDAYLHMMNIYDPRTGSRVRDVMLDAGAKRPIFAPSNTSDDYLLGLSEVSFNIAEKVAKIKKDACEVDIAFVGHALGHNRKQIAKMWEQARADDPSLKARIHGNSFPQGILPGPYAKSGQPVAKLYAESMFGFNTPYTSIWNTRLMDYWFSGTVQFLYDPFGEAAEFGFNNLEHYILFNGTAEDLLAKYKQYRPQLDLIADIAQKAYDKGTTFHADMCVVAQWGRLLGEKWG